MDQTRIHIQSYVLAMKVACDVVYDQNQNVVGQIEKLKAVKEVIMNPKRLKEIDMN